MKPTKRQSEIIQYMKQGYRLFTTEGNGYYCWLRIDDEESKNIPVGRSTCESMHKKDLIKPAKDTDSRFFEWELK